MKWLDIVKTGGIDCTGSAKSYRVLGSAQNLLGPGLKMIQNEAIDSYDLDSYKERRRWANATFNFKN